MTKGDQIYAYLKEQQVESRTERSINKVLRERPGDAQCHMAASLLSHSPHGLELLAEALHELSHRPAGAAPADVAAWIAGKIGSPSAYRLKLRDLLDIFHIVQGFPALKAALVAYPDAESRAKAMTEASTGKSPTEAQLEHARANLAVVGALSPQLTHLIERVLALSFTWTVDATGRVDNPPTVATPFDDALDLSQEEAFHLKRLLFCHAPPAFLDFGKCRAMREKAFGVSRSAAAPFAIVTVGAPGAGKSHVLTSRMVPDLAQRFGGPAYADYSHIDPDLFISQLCDNDNAFRSLANFCNHESFLTAVGQKRHLFFDGTGKDLNNTCGRVISRMRAAGYRVFVAIVAAKYETCLTRIAERQVHTGRGVPEMFVRMAMEGMGSAVPVYIQQQEKVAEAVLLYDNEGPEESPPRVLQGGDAVAASEALAFFTRMMALPAKAK